MALSSLVLVITVIFQGRILNVGHLLIAREQLLATAVYGFG